jgi:hypothetical protein
MLINSAVPVTPETGKKCRSVSFRDMFHVDRHFKMVESPEQPGFYTVAQVMRLLYGHLMRHIEMEINISVIPCFACSEAMVSKLTGNLITDDLFYLPDLV